MMNPTTSFTLILFELCLGIILCKGEHIKTSFQLSFPLKPHSAYARLQNTIPYPLQEFTLCHWTRKRTISTFGSVFSYAVSNFLNNELLSAVTYREHNYVTRREYGYESNTSTAFNQKWIHHCTTWSSYTQEFHIFQNGKEVNVFRVKGPPHSNPVLPGGVVIFGQDQDVVGGGFDPKECFNGDISEVHLWDHILCQDQIFHLSQCQAGDLEGNIISWSKSFFTFDGLVEMSPVTLCEENCL